MAKPPPPASSPFWTLFNAFGGLQVRLMHLTRGRVGGKLMGVPVLVLHHRGRRSGKARETPLMYLEDGADVVVVGSKGGTDTHPAWFHNLMAMSETEVEVEGERRRVRPRLADAEERARLWPRLVELYTPYEEYQSSHEPGDPGRLAQARRLSRAANGSGSCFRVTAGATTWKRLGSGKTAAERSGYVQTIVRRAV